MKKLFLIGLVLFSSLYAYNGEKKETIGIAEYSKLKRYNPQAVWQDVKCSRCNGTGSETVSRYDAKNNRMIKYQVPCLRCRGKGTVGRSKL